MSPNDQLLPVLSEATIRSLLADLSLPSPSSVRPFQACAEFHSIYFLTFDSSYASSLEPARRNLDGSTTLVLRVSGRHISHRKTANEVAVMRWVRENTNLPVPLLVKWDASCDNVLGREFTLLERVEGRSVDGMYDEMGEKEKMWLVSQLTDAVIELNRHEWKHVGGLRFNDQGEIVPGPVLEDTFWMAPDIEKFWGPGESVETLNPSGPYNSHAEYLSAYVSCFIHAIEVHPSLEWLASLIPQLHSLQGLLPSMASLKSTRLLLSHKDLHLANVNALPSGKLTGILDWEFATIVPALRWDPVRAFLWNGRYTEDAAKEKERLRGKFEEELDRRGVQKWWEDVGKEDAERVWTVVKFMRALVEVCPRGQRQDKVKEWKQTVQLALNELGV